MSDAEPAVERLPFDLQDRSAEQLGWMSRALELLTALRMVRREELAAESGVFDDVTEGLSAYDVGRLLAAVCEVTDRLLSTAPDERVQSWLTLLGESLAVAQDVASVREGLLS